MKSVHYLLFQWIIGLIFTGCIPDSKEAKSRHSLFQELQTPAGPNSSLPYLVNGLDGNLYLSWIEKMGDTTALMYAMMTDGDWSVPSEVARGTNWFVNWADYPMLAVNEEGSMIAHFLAKSGSGTYSYDVNITQKNKGETAWSTPVVIHSDGTATEHGFVTLLPLGNGKFQVAWLDGRNTLNHSGEHAGAMTLRSAVCSQDGSVAMDMEIDDRVCDCCQTTGVVTSNGPVIIYRDRSDFEIRDMYISRLVEDEWTAPQPVVADNWTIAGCPVNGPRADAIGNNLAIAWYAAPTSKPQVKVVFSTDGGRQFGSPVMIDDNNPLGRVDLVMLDENRAMVSWLAKGDSTSVIKVRIVHKNGTTEPPVSIVHTSEVRGSGFPQLAKSRDRLFVAWTDVSGDYPVVKCNVMVE